MEEITRNVEKITIGDVPSSSSSGGKEIVVFGETEIYAIEVILDKYQYLDRQLRYFRDGYIGQECEELRMKLCDLEMKRRDALLLLKTVDIDRFPKENASLANNIRQLQQSHL